MRHIVKITAFREDSDRNIKEKERERLPLEVVWYDGHKKCISRRVHKVHARTRGITYEVYRVLAGKQYNL